MLYILVHFRAVLMCIGRVLVISTSSVVLLRPRWKHQRSCSSWRVQMMMRCLSFCPMSGLTISRFILPVFVNFYLNLYHWFSNESYAVFSSRYFTMQATEPSRRLLHLFGTVCRSQYGHRRHCKFIAADRRPSFLPGRTAALTKSVSLHWLPRDFTAIPTCYVSLQS